MPFVVQLLRLPQAFVHRRDADLVVLGDIRRADAEGHAQTGVLIGLHNSVDVRIVGHFIDGRHAIADAPQTAEQHAIVPLVLRERPLCPEHAREPLRDVQVVERALRQALHHVRVQISHAGQHQKTRCLDNGTIGLQMGCDRRKAAFTDENIGLRGRSCFEIGEHCPADQQHRSASAAAVNSRPRACASIGEAAPVA